jgi:hypothetical protein
MRLSEVEIERMLDLMVQRKLTTDREYRNAESSDHAAAREAEITAECEAELKAKYS